MSEILLTVDAINMSNITAHCTIGNVDFRLTPGQNVADACQHATHLRFGPSQCAISGTVCNFNSTNFLDNGSAHIGSPPARESY